MNAMNQPTQLTTRIMYCTAPHRLATAQALVEWVRREVEHGYLGSGKNQLGAQAWQCPAELLQQVRDAAMLVMFVPSTSTTQQLLQVPHGTQAAMLVQEWLVDVLVQQMPLPRGYLGATLIAEQLEAWLGE